MQLEVIRLPGRTPLLFIEVPGRAEGTVLLYGHMDKQPEMTGWSEGLGPWTPVLRGDRSTAVAGRRRLFHVRVARRARGLQDQGVPHARCVVIIEGCEESGSFDLPHYIEHLARADRHAVGRRVLDSGAADYERLWCTTSLRGMVIATCTSTCCARACIGRGERHRAVELQARAAAPLPDRGRAHGAGAARVVVLRRPRERVEQAQAMAGALGDAVWSTIRGAATCAR